MSNHPTIGQINTMKMVLFFVLLAVCLFLGGMLFGIVMYDIHNTNNAHITCNRN